MAKYIRHQGRDTDNPAVSQVETGVDGRGAVHVGNRDSEGNEILPAFSPSATYDLSATTSSQRQALGTATTVRLTSISNFTPPEGIIRIAFGDSSVTAAAAATGGDMAVNVDVDKEPTILYVPSTATHMAFIRETNCTGDVAFELTVS